MEMNQKRIVIAACLLAMLMAGAINAGCSAPAVENPTAVGKYVDEDDHKLFIELNSDGTFYLKKSASSGYHGKWELKANKLRLHIEMMGLTMELEKQGDTLYEFTDSGRVSKRYIKEK
ncbi:MAG: hypothetical protein A4E35_00840 [Methanoregula sp. PtaU1.Bin051]|nr:MAG: hypothetical protein A4E35_00840 [Methanoregula sp. PtaU1.Bin051]